MVMTTNMLAIYYSYCVLFLILHKEYTNTTIGQLTWQYNIRRRINVKKLKLKTVSEYALVDANHDTSLFIINSGGTSITAST